MGMSLLRWVAGATLGVLASGCGGAASEPEPDTAAGSELDADDWTSEWRRLALPNLQLAVLGITRTPGGWFLIASPQTFVGDYVYRSSDGVRWTQVHLPDERGRLTGIAYGGGRYVIVGHSQDASPLIWTSTDGESWTAPQVTEGFGLDGVQFVEGRFIGWGFDIWSSQDAESWVQSRRDGFYSGAGVAFGAGRYLLVGTGVPQLSSDDGLSWSSAPIDCSLDSACIADVDEGTPYNSYRGVIFAEGYFHLNRLRSRDGQNWEEVGGLVPTSYLSGRFLHRDFAFPPDPGTLEAWSEGGTPQPIDVLAAPEAEPLGEGAIPETLDYSWSDGLDCTSARCVLLGNELFLIP